MFDQPRRALINANCDSLLKAIGNDRQERVKLPLNALFERIDKERLARMLRKSLTLRDNCRSVDVEL